MEILAHTLWTTAGAKIANNIAKKKNKKFKINYFWVNFWGLFPDLFSLSLPIVVFIFDYFFSGMSVSSIAQTREVINSYNISLVLYPITHSIVIWIFVFGLIWIIKKKPVWVITGWLFHIILDMPSHGIGAFGTPIFYPISEYRFPYGISWASTEFFIINYSLLFILWGFILFFKYRKKKV